MKIKLGKCLGLLIVDNITECSIRSLFISDNEKILRWASLYGDV